MTTVTVKNNIKFNDLIAGVQIASGIPYALYELISFTEKKSIEQKLLLALWGVASLVDVTTGAVYFVRKAGIKVKIPKHVQDAERLVLAMA